MAQRATVAELANLYPRTIHTFAVHFLILGSFFFYPSLIINCAGSMLGHYRPLQNAVFHQYENIQLFPKLKKLWSTGQNLYQHCARHILPPDLPMRLWTYLMCEHNCFRWKFWFICSWISVRSFLLWVTMGVAGQLKGWWLVQAVLTAAFWARWGLERKEESATSWGPTVGALWETILEANWECSLAQGFQLHEDIWKSSRR